MWNDIHTNADKLKENAIIASSMEKSYSMAGYDSGD